jgi:hypothetical protein
VDPVTGTVLWQFGWIQAGAPRAVQAHVLGSSRVVAGTLSGPGVGLVDVTQEGDRWTVAEVWATTQMKPEFPDFVVHQGHAYGFDDALFCCLDLAFGKRRWKDGRYRRGQVMLLPEQSLLLVISEQGEVLLPVIERCWFFDIPRFFRGDAAFASPKLLRLLEREGFRHATRDRAPLFPGNALQSLTSSGSLF